MTAPLACMVCVNPFESLLSSGLHAGVLVMAVLTLVVIGALTRGAWRVVRDDARESGEAAAPPASPVTGGRT